MFSSGPDTSGPHRFGSEHLPPSASRDHDPREPIEVEFRDALDSNCLRLTIGGIEHRGGQVLQDIQREFPDDQFEPEPRQHEFRSKLLQAATLPVNSGPELNTLVRDMIVHDFLGQALVNLTNMPQRRAIFELRADGESPLQVETPAAARREYLASAWAVRSFIRLAATDRETFSILVQKMAEIREHLGKFPLGVPMSPVLAHELFNATVTNPHLRNVVIHAFQIIGHRGTVAESLFDEFSAALDRQYRTDSRLQAG